MTNLLVFPNLFFIKDSLKAESYQFTLFRMLTFVPWNLKPIVGYVADSKSFFGYRLKFWVVLGGCLYLISCVAMFLFVPTLN